MEAEAGREFDARIAEVVFGYTLDYEFADLHVPPAPHVKELRDQHDEWGILPAYSSDIAAAWLVVEALERRGWYVEIGWCNGQYGPRKRAWCYVGEYGSDGDVTNIYEDTAPLAICRAALEALTR